jgi:hypothetical protein
MLQSPGLRLSFAGAIVFFISLPGLLFLPDIAPALGMMIGGAGVWCGFMWTLYGYYLTGSQEDGES